MWVESNQLQQIGSALETGRTEEIDRLLAGILADGREGGAAPGACAVCRRELLREELVPGRLVVQACPAEHGAWLDADARAGLERLLTTPVTTSVSWTRILTAVIGIVALSVAGLAVARLAVPEPPPVQPRPMAPEARRYVVELMTVLDEGISNRQGIDGVLKGESERDTYRAAYDVYRRNQEGVLGRLRALAVPDSLQPVHAKVVSATERQIAFYAAFAEARAGGGAANVAGLLDHPDRRATDYDLHRAWDLFRGLYPGLDQQFSDALEGRFCAFDVI